LFLKSFDDGQALYKAIAEPLKHGKSLKAGVARWYEQQSHDLKPTTPQAALFNDSQHGMQVL
tara:strand:+ start:300 stop:485 length:186 start_codon:yes stop_codon:yes gene_type:complete